MVSCTQGSFQRIHRDAHHQLGMTIKQGGSLLELTRELLKLSLLCQEGISLPFEIPRVRCFGVSQILDFLPGLSMQLCGICITRWY